MPKIETLKWFSVDECAENPGKLYIFGDNVIGKGKKGQAVIRDCKNSFGIPTKRAPSMAPKSFMEDGALRDSKEIESSLKRLKNLESCYGAFVFPEDGLGTGLSQMPAKCPILFHRLNKYLVSRYKLGGVYATFRHDG